MTDLEAFKQMMEKVNQPGNSLAIKAKHNPDWETRDRVLFSVGRERVCFCFDQAGQLWAISWSPYQDEVG